MDEELSVSLRGVEKTLGQFHLGPIDLDVKEPFVLLGPSGAGKTTLFEIIAGFIRPDKGKIYCNGEEITGKKPEKRNLGIVYQDYQLFPHLNVMENIGFGLKFRRMSGREIDERVRGIAEMFNIGHLMQHNVRSLSGGEKQRVALARALVVGPKILLLDEPFSAVDEEGRAKLREEFNSLRKHLDCLVILITHNQEEAYEMAEKIAILYGGRIMAHGERDEVFGRPKTVKIARFLGFKNILSSKELIALNIEPPSSNGFFALPNEKIRLDGTGGTLLRGTIERYESLRNQTKVVINVGGVRLEKEIDRNFEFTGPEIDFGVNSNELLPLE